MSFCALVYSAWQDTYDAGPAGRAEIMNTKTTKSIASSAHVLVYLALLGARCFLAVGTYCRGVIAQVWDAQDILSCGVFVVLFVWFRFFGFLFPKNIYIYIYI